MREHSGAFPIKLEAGFSFFAVLGFMICTDRSGTSLLCLLSCVLHELGHLAVMLAEKRLPERIKLYGGGMHIRGGSTSFPAAAAGCIVNTLLFCVFFLIPWESRELRLFGVINLLNAAFNLLPFGELDGKLMLDKALIRAFPPEKAARYSSVCEKAVTAAVLPAAVFLVFSGYLNISALIFFFYNFAVEILEKI